MTPVADNYELRCCTAEIQSLLPALPTQYQSLILISALIEHVGNALSLAQRTGTCTPEVAHKIVARVKQLALAPHSG